MTQDNSYRERAQSVRQAARAHLLEIRRIRLSRRPGLAAPVTSADSGLAQVDIVEAAEVLAESTGAHPFVLLIDPEPAETVPSELAVPPEAETATEEEVAAPVPKAKRKPATSAKRPKTSPSREMSPKSKSAAKAEVAMSAAAAKAAPLRAAIPQEDLAILQAAMDEITEEAALPDALPLASVPLAPEPVPETPFLAEAEAGDDVLPAPASVDPGAAGAVASVPEPQLELVVEPDPPADHGSTLYALPGAGPGLVWMLEQVGIDSLNDLARADAVDLGVRLGLVGQILNVPSWIAFAQAQTLSSSEGR